MPRPPQKEPRTTANKSVSRTHAILNELFLHPPISRPELEQRLTSAHLPTARKWLIDKLDSPQLSDSDGELLVGIFHCLGIETDTAALITIVTDSKRERRIRAYALTILLHEDPTYSESLREFVPDNELLMLAAQPLCNVLATIEAEPAEAEDLASALESVSEDMRLPLFGQLEEYRQQVGTPAAVAYEQTLRRDSLRALRPQILTALLTEGGNDAIALLESMRNEETKPEARRALQGALLRLHTRALEGRQQSLGSCFAHISSCDGQGAYFVLGYRQNPDQRTTLAMMCVRAAGDIRDGYVVPCQPKQQIDALLKKFTQEAGTLFVRVPLAQASGLIAGAVQRTLAQGLAVPIDAIPALRFFERSEPQPAQLPPPAARHGITTVRRLLERPEYVRSWFFDDSDLLSAGVSPPSSEDELSDWLQEAAQRLAAVPPLRSRIVAMAEHMALWHHLRGEAAESALCTAAAQATQRNFAKSALVRALLERSATEAPSPHQLSEHEDQSHQEFTGDLEHESDQSGLVLLSEPARRQYLKSRFFADIDEPKGSDLAWLDLTEATLLSLQVELNLQPGDARPRDDAQHAAALEIARIFRDFMLGGRGKDPRALGSKFTTVLVSTCRLPKRTCEQISRALLKAVASFVDEVCHSCRVGCFAHPSSPVKAAFFSPEHPAVQQLSADESALEPATPRAPNQVRQPDA